MWESIVESIGYYFNIRLDDRGLKESKFNKTTLTKMDRMLGKELSVLLWGLEELKIEEATNAVQIWLKWSPEERWFLYSQCACSEGWRKALKSIFLDWRT